MCQLSQHILEDIDINDITLKSCYDLQGLLNKQTMGDRYRKENMAHYGYQVE
jgi:hypothetical protein